MLSIIVPTLNEEKYLPLLLDSIKKQNFQDYEIIVADAGSKDGTLEIAKKFGCKIVSGGKPSKGKNQGVKAAKGELLLFLDADVILPQNFFKKSLQEFRKRNLGAAGHCVFPLSENKAYPLLFDIFYNIPIVSLEKILPHAAMGVFMEKKLFEKLGGFDQKIKLAEDHDLARRAAKISKFGIIRSAKVMISDRRFKEDGLFNTALKYFLCELHMIFLGPVKSDIFKYRFNHYNGKLKNNH